MKILLVPKVIIRHKNQIEFSIEENLILFLKKTFKNCLIEITHDLSLKKKVDLIILSGGNTIKKYSNKIKDLIRNKYDNFYFKNSIKFNIPLIGICHGAQFIAHKNNLKFKKDKKHVNFSHNILSSNKKLTGKIKSVICYHNYKIVTNNKNIAVIAHAKDNSVESFWVKKKKIAGIIWHPERSKKEIIYQINFFKKIYASINSSFR